jgi:hypothetical protein
MTRGHEELQIGCRQTALLEGARLPGMTFGGRSGNVSRCKGLKWDALKCASTEESKF